MTRVVLVLALVACSSHAEPVKPMGNTGSGSGSATGSGSTAARPVAPMPEVSVGAPGFLYCKGADYQGVIASERGTWTPSPQDVADAEAALGPALAAHSMAQTYPPSTLLREYTGIEKGGTKLVQIRLACMADPDWPEKGLPYVRDGGDCYGTTTVDLATGTVGEIRVNGAG